MLLARVGQVRDLRLCYFRSSLALSVCRGAAFSPLESTSARPHSRPARRENAQRHPVRAAPDSFLLDTARYISRGRRLSIPTGHTLRAARHAALRFSVFYDITDGCQSAADLNLSASTTSVAASFRSTCGPLRGAPDTSTHRCPAATPHVGHGTEDNCLRVSSVVFISEQNAITPIRTTVPF